MDVRIDGAQLVIDADAAAHRQARGDREFHPRPQSRRQDDGVAGNVLAAHQPQARDARITVDAAHAGIEHHAHAAAFDAVLEDPGSHGVGVPRHEACRVLHDDDFDA